MFSIDTTYLIKGSTYAIKSDLKMLGCTWNPDLKVWEILSSSQNAGAVIELVNYTDKVWYEEGK